VSDFSDEPGKLKPQPASRNGFRRRHPGNAGLPRLHGPFLFELKGTPAEYTAGLKLAIERGWLEKHESGTCVKFTQAGADLFA